MSSFVQAVLERNEPGAEYGGVVYDRRLTLRHPSGRVLEVFDMAPPLAGGLEVGRTYDFVLTATLPVEARVGNDVKAPWRGVVVDASWSPPPGLIAREGLSGRRWLLVETDVGRALLDRSELPSDVRVGERVAWRDARFDLYGLGNPRDTA